MKKLLLSLVFVFAMCATCFAAKIEPSATSSKIFQDSEYKISVQLPEGFDYADEEGPDVVVAADDKKGATYNVVAVEADPKEVAAATNKDMLKDIVDKQDRKLLLDNGLELYHEYTVKINPDHVGYFMDGYVKGNGDNGKVKTSIIIFYHNNKKFTVTLKAPYNQKGYLKSFKRFRTSITCKN